MTKVMTKAMTSLPCHCFKLHAGESKSRISLNTQYSCTRIILPDYIHDYDKMWGGADNVVKDGGAIDLGNWEKHFQKITFGLILSYMTEQLA